MKKTLTLALILTLVFTMTASAINVVVDGRTVTFKDAQPVIREGRTLVPVSTIANELDIPYMWENSTQTINFKQGDKEVELKIGQEKSFIEKGRTYVPLAYIAKAFGAEVNWQDAIKTAFIFTEGYEGDKEVVYEKVKEEIKEELNKKEKPYNELSDFQAVPLKDAAILKNATLGIYDRDEWATAEPIENVYFITKEDLPIQFGNVVITGIEAGRDNTPYKWDRLVFHGYVLEGKINTGTFQAGFVDKDGYHRSRSFFNFDRYSYDYLANKFPNLIGLNETIEDRQAIKGEKFSIALQVVGEGEKDFPNYKKEQADKILLYDFWVGKDLLVIDNFFK